MPPEDKPAGDGEQQQQPTIESVIDQAIVDATPQPSSSTETDDNGSEEDPAAAAAAEEHGDDPAAAAAAGAGDGAHGDDPSGDGSGDPGATKAGGGKPAADADKGGQDPGAAAAKPNGKDVDPDAGKPKPPDVVNDPIPDEVKGKTRTRMTSLIDTVKATTKELEESRGQTDGFLKAIADTGADPETFARHVEVLRLMNSSDPAEQRSAVKFLRGAADKIAGELGERPAGKELEGHEDLAEEVEEGSLTRARAIEIANQRNAKKAEETRAARAKEAADAEASGQAAINTARDELNALEADLRKADPLYDRKRAAIYNAAKALIPTIPPKQWKAAYKRLYDSVDEKTLPRPQPRVGDGGQRRGPAGTGDRQPLRPRQGAGGGGPKVPTSISEAIDFGIEQANRR